MEYNVYGGAESQLSNYENEELANKMRTWNVKKRRRLLWSSAMGGSCLVLGCWFGVAHGILEGVVEDVVRGLGGVHLPLQNGWWQRRDTSGILIPCGGRAAGLDPLAGLG